MNMTVLVSTLDAERWSQADVTVDRQKAITELAEKRIRKTANNPDDGAYGTSVEANKGSRTHGKAKSSSIFREEL